MVVFVQPQLLEIFEVKVRSLNFTLYFLIKWAIFKDLWFWPKIFLKVVVTQTQKIWHFKALIDSSQILGGQHHSNPFCIIFSCFKNVILLYVYYMRYLIIRDTLYELAGITNSGIINSGDYLYSSSTPLKWRFLLTSIPTLRAVTCIP